MVFHGLKEQGIYVKYQASIKRYQRTAVGLLGSAPYNCVQQFCEGYQRTKLLLAVELLKIYKLHDHCERWCVTNSGTKNENAQLQ